MDVGPEDVVVAVDRVDDAVVEAVELLQQGELLPDLQELGVRGHGQAKQLLPSRVRDVLAEEVVKAILRNERFTLLHPFIPPSIHPYTLPPLQLCK